MNNHDKLWDIFGGKKPDTYSIRQEMESIAEAAYEFYKLRKHEDALVGYRKAFKMAESVDDTENMIEYKWWTGHCLQRLNRYREALAEFLTLSQMKPIVPRDYFDGLINQLVIATCIPIELYKIKGIVRQCYDFIQQNGMSNCESKILRNESDLARFRYDYEHAFSLSTEALAKHNKNAVTCYNEVSYYYDIMLNLVTLKQLTSLRDWLLKLQDLDTKFTVSKQLYVLRFKVEIALLEGNTKEAYDFAKKHLRYNRETGSDCYVSLRLVIRTGISAGKLDSLKEYLIELAKLRNSEDGHMRYTIQKLFGEYHAACYNHNKSSQGFFAAKRYFNRALKIGIHIDRLLECDGRQKEIAELLGEIENIKNQ